MWKKPIPKDHIFCDFIYMKCPEEINLYRQKVDQGPLGLRGLGENGE